MVNTVNKNILFRCDANSIVGMGHFTRCCTLALGLRAEGHTPYFLMRNPSHLALKKLKALSIRGYSISMKEGDEQEILLKRCKEHAASLVIFDIVHLFYLKRVPNILNQINALKLEKIKVAFIDDMDAQCFSLKNHIDADLLLIPYYGAEELDLLKYSSQGVRILCGVKYFPLGPNIIALARQNTKKRSTNTLNLIVSLGGTQITIKDTSLENELSILSDQYPSLNIRIVESVTRPAINSRISIIPFNQKFNEQLRWADIALIGSGLSRYETAYSGVPAVVVLTSKSHKSMVQKFAKSQSIIYGGNLNNAKRAANCLRYIISDPILLSHMSRYGKKLIDGYGTKRIIHQIRCLLS